MRRSSTDNSCPVTGHLPSSEIYFSMSFFSNRRPLVWIEQMMIMMMMLSMMMMMMMMMLLMSMMMIDDDFADEHEDGSDIAIINVYEF